MKNVFILICICATGLLRAQTFRSVMQEESAWYGSLGYSAMDYYQLNTPAALALHTKAACVPQKMILGWHPYWQNGLEVNYDWNLLTDFVYFSYEVNPYTGQPNTTYNFLTVPAVTAALANNARVHLCVTLFSDHAAFFSNVSAQATLGANLVSLLQARGAHGINIDFEGVPVSQKSAFTAFLVQLGTTLHNAGFQLSVCLYAVDWSNLFEEIQIEPYVDFFTLMGYDYYYSGSTQAGPTDPLYGFTNAYDRSLSRSVSYYLNEGIPGYKLVLGLPYYGREWNTVSSSLPSAVTANPSSAPRTYAYVKTNASGNYSVPQPHSGSASRVYVYPNAGAYRQCFISEENELLQRYRFVQRRNLAGIGIWALAYDDGYTQLWDALAAGLTSCYTDPCSDTLYDMGGPAMNYYANETYSYSIAPPGAVGIHLEWDLLDLESGYDSLYIYAGTQAQGTPLLALSGNVLPAPADIPYGAFTLRFRSDGATQAQGWQMRYSCITDTVLPLTTIMPQQEWLTDSMYIRFHDSDNVQLQNRYWLVSDWDGTHFSANPNAGFFNEDFTTNAYGWQTYAGTWNYTGGELVQSNETEGNTNYYTYFRQDAPAYVYEMEFSGGGSGTNRRLGLHFMCDDAAWPNRNNSYFVWFRIDDQQLQFYKVVNDTFYLKKSVPCSLNTGQYYGIRTEYVKQDGRISVWQNQNLLGVWQDPQPYTTGDWVSLRTGNATMHIRSLKIYRSRADTTYIHAGTECRYPNQSPLAFAARIYSLLNDVSGRITVADTGIRADFTAPVYTGLCTEDLPDRDTLLAGISVQLYLPQFTDTHSGRQAVYRILDNNGNTMAGPYAYTSPVQAYTPSGLPDGQYYRIAAQARNGAGMWSDTLYSDGFYIEPATAALEDLMLVPYAVYPNPFRESLTLQCPPGTAFCIADVSGRVVCAGRTVTAEQVLDLRSLHSGTYYLITAKNTIPIIKTD